MQHFAITRCTGIVATVIIGGMAAHLYPNDEAGWVAAVLAFGASPAGHQCPLWVKSRHLRAKRHVRFNPESRHVQRTSPCLHEPIADIFEFARPPSMAICVKYITDDYFVPV